LLHEFEYWDVGLANVGKSTLFNALLKKQTAFVANYPFATIEPNIGVVPVPDERLTRLAEITQAEHKMVNPPPIIPATVSFVDMQVWSKARQQGRVWAINSCRYPRMRCHRSSRPLF